MDGIAHLPAEPAPIRASLRERVPVTDDIFDQLYPEVVRARSRVHWTPVAVALRAVELLAPEAGLRVLDVGSGCGKVCCIGALASDATWDGIECDPRLVGTAIKTACLLDVDRHVRFTCGDMTRLDWSDYASLYLFNPFEAALFEPEPFDLDIAFARYAESVTETEDRLADLPAGTRVVTYHGFGGEMPDCFEVMARETIGCDPLVLWVKRPRGHASRAGRWQASA